MPGFLPHERCSLPRIFDRLLNIARSLQYATTPDFEQSLEYTKKAAIIVDRIIAAAPGDGEKSATLIEMRGEIGEKVRLVALDMRVTAQIRRFAGRRAAGCYAKRWR